MNSTLETLPFRPMKGFASPHAQTVFSNLLSKSGETPPSAPYFIPLEDGDILQCTLSTPPHWNGLDKTIILIHGMGGSQDSSYMIRMSRKLYQRGCRVMRMNLRGTGPGALLAKKPYHGGTSNDVRQVIELLKREKPQSPIVLIGYSLGGNIALKLVGELGERADALLEKTIAVCAPVDLKGTTQMLGSGMNQFYHRYYVRGLKRLGHRWLEKQPIHSITDFDHAVTAPQWGFKDALDYYRQCSSCHWLPNIRHTCHLIFAEDDPFVDYRVVLKQPLSPRVNICLSRHGGHMGFWGWAGREHVYHWLDRRLLEMALNV